MAAPIGSNFNVNPVQMLQAQNAFKAASAPKQPTKPEVSAEDAYVPKEMPKMFSEHDLDEIKQCAQAIGEDITNEDIKYGMYYGRSVITDCVV